MHTVLTYLTGAALIATAFVLVMGLFTMVTKDHKSERSNKLIRWRIGLQAAALIIFSLLLLSRHS